ncbi:MULTISPECIES: hypothetical protein [unclassified Erwinia]|uniref:hypothetical protein n=1 Tax=unclassified Erwinia TaxID=2622719 RepID=UPI00138F34AC|nr:MULTISPECIES: hypothetical protein [unclassified Erwinia]
MLIFNQEAASGGLLRFLRAIWPINTSEYTVAEPLLAGKLCWSSSSHTTRFFTHFASDRIFCPATIRQGLKLVMILFLFPVQKSPAEDEILRPFAALLCFGLVFINDERKIHVYPFF